MKRIIVSVLMIMATAALLLVAGCGKPVDDNTAAADVMEAYLNAFNDQDVDALVDIIYCEARYDSRTREDLAEELRSSIDAVVGKYGEGYRYVFNRDEFAYGDATQQMNTLNEFLGLTDADIKVDAARIVSAEMCVVDSEGVEIEAARSTMMVYRYDGQWYLYGSVA